MLFLKAATCPGIKGIGSFEIFRGARGKKSDLDSVNLLPCPPPPSSLHHPHTRNAPPPDIDAECSVWMPFPASTLKVQSLHAAEPPAGVPDVHVVHTPRVRTRSSSQITSASPSPHRRDVLIPAQLAPPPPQSLRSDGASPRRVA